MDRRDAAHLSSADVERIARRVAELLRAPATTRLVDAATVARELSVERDWVYAHARALGAIRLGGPRGRMRFDLTTVRDRLAEGQHDDTRSARGSWRAPPKRPGPMELLPVHVASSPSALGRARRPTLS